MTRSHHELTLLQLVPPAAVLLGLTWRAAVAMLTESSRPPRKRSRQNER